MERPYRLNLVTQCVTGSLSEALHILLWTISLKQCCRSATCGCIYLVDVHSCEWVLYLQLLQVLSMSVADSVHEIMYVRDICTFRIMVGDGMKLILPHRRLCSCGETPSILSSLQTSPTPSDESVLQLWHINCSPSHKSSQYCPH